MQPITIWRRLSQVAFFVFTGEWLAIGWLRCPYGVPFVSCTSCPLTDCPGRYLQLPFIGLIGLSALLSGRVFCGWACPMGLVQDALGRIRKPKGSMGPRFGRVDKYLKYLKYVALAAVIVLIFIHNEQWARPYDYVTRSPSVFNIGAIQVAWAMGGGTYKVRFVILMVALVGALFISRFWCRYLCPLGALISLFNKFSLLTIRRAWDWCRDCGKYPRECIQYTVPRTTDCVMCGECVQGCPAKALSFGLRGKAPKRAEVEGEADQPPDESEVA